MRIIFLSVPDLPDDGEITLEKTRSYETSKYRQLYLIIEHKQNIWIGRPQYDFYIYNLPLEEFLGPIFRSVPDIEYQTLEWTHAESLVKHWGKRLPVESEPLNMEKTDLDRLRLDYSSWNDDVYVPSYTPKNDSDIFIHTD